jgi:aspartate 1-decarboxylase
MAHIGERGDVVIIIAYAHLDHVELATHRPRIVHVDADNRVREEVAVS